MTLIEQIKKLKQSSKKRNFDQRFDLIVNLKDLNLEKTENRIDEIFVLPNTSGKPASITLFSDSAKKIQGCKILKSNQIQKLAKDKKKRKELIKQTNFFLSEPKLMPVIGKHLGKFLAPINKMPKPVAGEIEKTVKNYKNGVKITVKKQPLIHLPIGSERMKEEYVAENIQAVLNFLKKKLPKGKNNIKNVYLKLTMSHPTKLEV